MSKKTKPMTVTQVYTILIERLENNKLNEEIEYPEFIQSQYRQPTLNIQVDKTKGKLEKIIFIKNKPVAMKIMHAQTGDMKLSKLYLPLNNLIEIKNELNELKFKTI